MSTAFALVVTAVVVLAFLVGALASYLARRLSGRQTRREARWQAEYARRCLQAHLPPATQEMASWPRRGGA